VSSVAFKTLKTRLGNCIYKTSLLHRLDEHIRFTPSCPPHFATKLRPWFNANIFEFFPDNRSSGMGMIYLLVNHVYCTNVAKAILFGC